jgi:tetratricopeptide (TPR) repeat protein
MVRHSLFLVLITSLVLNLAGSPGPARSQEVSLQDLQQAVQKEPDNPQVHYMLGLMHELEGNPAKAMQAYQQAVSLKSDYPEALYRVGELKGAQGDQEGAIQALAKAISLKPDYQEARATLATVYGQKGSALLEQGRWADAAQALQEAVALNPGDDAGANNLGIAYVAQGDWSRAVAAFQTAILANPANVDAHYNLGNTFLQIGDKEGALGQYAILGNLDPALAGDFFRRLSFPKGDPSEMTPYETPQFGQTVMRPSLPPSVAPSQPYLEDALRTAPDLQVPIMDTKMPAGQLR